MKILFSKFAEWQNELRCDRDAIHRGIVRVTKKFVQRTSKFTITRVFVVAAFRRGDEVLELREFVGEFLDDLDSRLLIETGDQRVKEVERWVQQQRLETRSGYYLEEGVLCD